MCQRCFRISELTEYLGVLSLQFPMGFAEPPPNSRELDLYSLMNTYFARETLTHHPCTQCRFVGSTEKTLRIINRPPMLVIHISRFDDGLEKIYHLVKYPLHLRTNDITESDGRILSYRLMGIIVHQGHTIREGHYFAFFNVDGCWYRAEDWTVTKVSRQRVVGLKPYLLLFQIRNLI